MRKTVKKFVFTIGSLALMASVLVGCGERVKYINETEDNLTLKLKEVMKNDSIADLEKFEILAVDVEKKGFKFDVVFNGVAGFEDESKAYMNVNYKVASEIFTHINKTASKESLFEIFNEIVKTHNIEDYSITNVKDFEKINKAITSSMTSPFDSYGTSKGLTYQISSPVFDDETQSISFSTKSLVKLGEYKGGAGIGFGFSFNGSFGMGIGMTHHTRNGTFVVSDTYQMDASNLNYEDLKNNPEKVFEQFVSAVKDKDASYIQVKRDNVNDVTYQNANDLGVSLLEIDREMGR